MSLAVEPKPGFPIDLLCFQPIGRSEIPLYKEKLFEQVASIVSVYGVWEGEFLEGGRAIVKAIFSDIFILVNDTDVWSSRCGAASLLPRL